MSEQVLRRIGAIGDIHGEDESLGLAIDHLRSLSLDAILSVGDIVDGDGDVNRCCRMLRDARAIAVRGNHERWVLENSMRMLVGATDPRDLDPEALAFLGALPATRTLETLVGRMLLCHGVGEHDMVRLLPDDDGYALQSNFALQEVMSSGVSLMLGGHTHQPMVRTFGGLTVINAGTLRRHDSPCYLVADFEKKQVQYFDIDPDEQKIRTGMLFEFGKPGQDVWGNF